MKLNTNLNTYVLTEKRGKSRTKSAIIPSEKTTFIKDLLNFA